MTQASRSSTTHPISVQHVAAGRGRIGMCMCPGKHDPGAADGPWARDLAADIQALRGWGADVLVTLVEDAELRLLRVADLGRRAQAAGLHWLHLPIRDAGVPDAGFEQAWRAVSVDLHRRLDAGDSLVLHCRGGYGRTGLVAARLLVERGMPPVLAIEAVRAARPGTIETAGQERFVLGCAPLR